MQPTLGVRDQRPPTHGGLCPISRRAYKQHIEYLRAEDIQRLHDDLLKSRKVEIAKQGIELRARPDDDLFKNTLGQPIDQRSFYRLDTGAGRRPVTPRLADE